VAGPPARALVDSASKGLCTADDRRSRSLLAHRGRETSFLSRATPASRRRSNISRNRPGPIRRSMSDRFQVGANRRESRMSWSRLMSSMACSPRLPRNIRARIHASAEPVGLSADEIRVVTDFAADRIGLAYDLRNTFDLLRYLLPTPPNSAARRGYHLRTSRYGFCGLGGALNSGLFRPFAK
jgi:hypothetical protein